MFENADVREMRVRLETVGKTFTLYLRSDARIEAVAALSFHVGTGECVALTGPSGAGKSSVLKMIYGSYRADCGRILVRAESQYLDVANASPREIMALRRTSFAYVSQFLRVIPRVSCLDIVASAALEGGLGPQDARERAQELLGRLNVSSRLWRLPPATFSGGEQQRVNIARGFAANKPIMLLDEPTASLDSVNRNIVVQMIREKKQAGASIVGIFHDADVRNAVADREIAMSAPQQHDLDHSNDRSA